MARKKAKKKAKPRTKAKTTAKSKQSYGKPGKVPEALQMLLLFLAVSVYAWFGVNMALNPSLMLDPVFAAVIVVWGGFLLVALGFYAFKKNRA